MKSESDIDALQLQAPVQLAGLHVSPPTESEMLTGVPNSFARAFINSYFFFAENVQTWDRNIVKDAPPGLIMGELAVQLPNESWKVLCQEGQHLDMWHGGDNKVGFGVGSAQGTWGDQWSGYFVMHDGGPNSTWLDNARRVNHYPIRLDWNLDRANRGNQLANSCMAFQQIWQMNLLVDGVHYMIPDLWWSPGVTGFLEGDTGCWFTSKLTIWSNWLHYEQMDCSHKDAAIQVYAYEHGDESKPVILEIKVVDPYTTERWNWPAACLGVKKVANLTFDGPGAFPDEFNWRLAKARFEKGWDNVPTQSWIKSGYYATMNPRDMYLSMEPYNEKLESCTHTILDQEMTSTNKDYVTQVVLRNDTNDTAQFKTSDFKHTITETVQMTYSASSTQKVAFTFKEALKAKENVIIEEAEVTVESSQSVELSFTETVTKAKTNTDTKEYTVTGQTINVPKKSSMKLMIEWWRAALSGTTKVMFPLTGKISTQVRTVSANSGAEIVDIDITKASSALGMVSVYDKAVIDDKTVNGAFVSAEMKFVAEVGVMADYSITPMPYVEPKS